MSYILDREDDMRGKNVVSVVTANYVVRNSWHVCRNAVIVLGAVLLTAIVSPAYAGTMVLTGENDVWGTVMNFCQNYSFMPQVLRLEKSFSPGGTIWSMGFCQFGLQRWYDAGIDLSRVTSVTFSFEGHDLSIGNTGWYKVGVCDIVALPQGTVADYPREYCEVAYNAPAIGYAGSASNEIYASIDVTAAFLGAVQSHSTYNTYCLDSMTFDPAREYSVPRLEVRFSGDCAQDNNDDAHHDDDNATIPDTIRPREPRHDHAGGVCLSWEDPGTAEGRVYTLYLGEDKSALNPIYTGTTAECKPEKLKFATVYYWQVESSDAGGVISRSPLASFTTVKKSGKAFNYPNPFNPARGENTHIVFDMPADGSAEISIFTEMGDLCWQRGFDNLPAGSNQLLYSGADDNRRTLYNGTYLCRIVKKHAGGQDTEHCRLLVVK